MPLKVNLNSFSYLKSGIPQDRSGHGGGFVFDCRFVNNPGRLEEFKLKTGNDVAVIEFLDSQKPMQEFLNNVYAITSMAIENYLSRNFTDLMISFGCTGGQHRSVYAAEKLKKFIIENFPQVSVELTHTEFPELNIL